MENDTNDIRKIGDKMMSGFESPKSSPEKSDKKGMFEMPSFEEKPQAKQGCSCGHDAQPKSDNMFGSFGEQPKEQSAKEMFGGGFGMATDEDSDKLKKLGERMMGQ